MFFDLMRSRRFAPLFWCQFLSAFNDNCVRQMLAMLILFDLGQVAAGTLITLAISVFILPSLLLSALGGEIADANDKARVARAIKVAEIAVQATAAIGFVLHSLVLLFLALFGLGIIAALFGPIKYGILPDHLETSELPAGNALIEGATFLAILFGLIVGGTIVARADQPWQIAVQLMVVALTCWATSCFIPATGIAAPGLTINRNVLASTFNLVLELTRDRRLWPGGIAVSWFWMNGAIALALVPVIVRSRIGGDIAVETAITALFAIGVGCGSILSAILAQGRIFLLPVPIAALLMAGFLVDLGRLTMGLSPVTHEIGIGAFLTSGIGFQISFDVVLVAVAGALLVVPAFTAVQAWAGEERRARIVAAVNVVSALFMVAGSLAASLLQVKMIGISPPVLLIVLGILNIGAAIYFFRALPGTFVIDAAKLALRLCCRLEVVGREHIDEAGERVVIAVNRSSRLDPVILLACLPNKPLFVIDGKFATRWWVKILPSSCFLVVTNKPQSLRRLVRSIEHGRRVVVFLGRPTSAHKLPKSYEMLAFLAEQARAQILAARLDGLEQAPFAIRSRATARRWWFPKVRMSFAAPQRPRHFAHERKWQRAGAAVYRIMTDLAFTSTSLDRTLIEALAEMARRHKPNTVLIEDPVSGALSVHQVLVGSAVLARKIMRFTEPGECVGLLLPNATATVITFFAVQASGRVAAMLNFTSGGANMRAACVAARVASVLTSRVFVEKADLGTVVAEIGEKATIVYLEDIRDAVTTLDKLRGLWDGGRALHRRRPHDPSTVLFTSGSEGVPKGVVLSHRNIIANIAQVVTRFDISSADIAFNPLPVFHTFGLTGCTLLPMLAGVKVYLYPSPLHYRQIPELIHKSGATFLFGTDTFLKHYGRIATPETFRSLRYVVAGGEPVSGETRALYKEKCGVTVLEGYGVTEASPVLAVNTPMFNRPGTVGPLVPGLEVRLEKVEGIDDGGRLFVRGPNVMLGYYRADNPATIEAAPDGWHDTADVVAIDEDGFVTVKGRVKRFAKIGGEMVSLAAIEQICEGLWSEEAFAVVAAPDAKKGERLIMVTSKTDAGGPELRTWMKAKGAAEVMIPSEILVVDALPRLGSGKIDYVELDRTVRSRRGAKDRDRIGSAVTG